MRQYVFVEPLPGSFWQAGAAPVAYGGGILLAQGRPLPVVTALSFL